MKTVYAVRALAVRNAHGSIIGWVRGDLFADGSLPSDAVFFRDGSSCGQVEGARRLSANPGLMYRTEAEAVRDGLERLRAANKLLR